MNQKKRKQRSEGIFAFWGLMLLFVVGGEVLGWVSNEIYENYQYDKQFEGLRFVGNSSHIYALEKTEEYDEYGDWVCVNVRDMDYSRALEVCQHEVGHEIFAKECEKNMTKCRERMLE